MLTPASLLWPRWLLEQGRKGEGSLYLHTQRAARRLLALSGVLVQQRGSSLKCQRALKPQQQLQLPLHGDLARFPFLSQVRAEQIPSGIWC